MFNRTTPTFNVEEIGYIQQGPSHRTVVSFVHYLDNTSHKKWYCDLRVKMYSVAQKKWWHTQRGISLPTRVCLEIYNLLLKMPLDPPKLDVKESLEFGRSAKYKDKDIVVSTVDYENGPKIDIREFMKAEAGYKGFTNKGVRIEYMLRSKLADMLMACYNRMVDFEKNPVSPQNGERKITEDVPF